MRGQIHACEVAVFVNDRARGMYLFEVRARPVKVSAVLFDCAATSLQFINGILGWKRFLQAESDHLPREILVDS